MERSRAGLEWDVTCLDTGVDTPTGGRVAARPRAARGGTFCLTYADGVADIDLAGAARLPRVHGGAGDDHRRAPANPWGVARLDGTDRVAGFHEKPQLDSWVNGGFL